MPRARCSSAGIRVRVRRFTSDTMTILTTTDLTPTRVNLSRGSNAIAEPFSFGLRIYSERVFSSRSSLERLGSRPVRLLPFFFLCNRFHYEETGIAIGYLTIEYH